MCVHVYNILNKKDVGEGRRSGFFVAEKGVCCCVCIGREGIFLLVLFGLQWVKRAGVGVFCLYLYLYYIP